MRAWVLFVYSVFARLSLALRQASDSTPELSSLTNVSRVTSFILLTSLAIACTQSPQSKFKQGNVSISAGKVSQKDLGSAISNSKSQQKIEELLEGSLVDLLENNLKLIKATVGDRSVSYNGHEFYDLQTILEEEIVYMKEQNLGEGRTVREIIEDAGYNVEEVKRGKIDQDFLDQSMEISANYFEKGPDLFRSAEESDIFSDSYSLRGPPARRTRGVSCGGYCTKPTVDSDAAPGRVNCGAASKAERIGTIAGGLCGGAGMACAAGALESAGAACIGLAVCAGMGGLTSAGGASASMIGGC